MIDRIPTILPHQNEQMCRIIYIGIYKIKSRKLRLCRIFWSHCRYELEYRSGLFMLENTTWKKTFSEFWSTPDQWLLSAGYYFLNQQGNFMSRKSICICGRGPEKACNALSYNSVETSLEICEVPALGKYAYLFWVPIPTPQASGELTEGKRYKLPAA